MDSWRFRIILVSNMNKSGKLIISLDFELHWGAPEKWDLSEKSGYFLETRRSIPSVLELFKLHEIHATWATVGFLFAKSKKQLLEYLPEERPNYQNKEFNYYQLIDKNQIGQNEDDDPFHYAYSLISLIQNTQGQELATHSFCHYYCNEKGQTLNQFAYDLKAAIELASDNFGVEIKSLVFPRNQFNSKYLSIAKDNGIKVVRSNPNVWFWQMNIPFKNIFRGADTLVPISRSLSFDENKIQKIDDVILLPSSRFLRAYTDSEKKLHLLMKKRVLDEMTYAAKNNKVYHLWWHPHNFGYNVLKNLEYLSSILEHYQTLKKKYNFLSNSMDEVFNI